MDIVNVLKEPNLLGHKRVPVTAAFADAAEEIECLRSELAAWRSALAKVGHYYTPFTNVIDDQAEEV